MLQKCFLSYPAEYGGQTDEGGEGRWRKKKEGEKGRRRAFVRRQRRNLWGSFPEDLVRGTLASQ